MTKPYHKPPTSIDQAEIIPFPASAQYRVYQSKQLDLIAAEVTLKVLEKTYQGGHTMPSPRKTHDYVVKMVNKVAEGRRI